MEEVLNIILSALSILVTGLVGWGVSALTAWLSSKIKDEKLMSYLNKITQIVTDAVMNVFQSFVDSLKAEGKFDKEAQEEAKQKALDIINSQLTGELKKFIETNYGDIQTWLNNKIEAVIYNLKNNKDNNK